MPRIPGGLAGQAWACFRDLGGERQIGMGAGPIPWRAVRAWADAHDVTRPDDFDDLVAIVQHLDGLWLKDAAAQVAKKTPKSSKR